ncbi:MAG: carbohydrate-binding family 9-like protein [Phycisphaerae bacterium]
MRQIRYLSVALIAALLACGCASTPPKHFLTEQVKPLPIMAAKYSSTPITIDGKLDEPVWKTARVYTMNLSKDKVGEGKDLQEAGEVRLAWDENYFYVGVKFYDSDIVAEGKQDQLHHYRMGDLCELFLKPNDHPWYWELYVTPMGKKTSFWFPTRGRLGLPSCFEYTCGLKVAAQVTGTLNNWRDKDCYWTGEMAMPIKDLTDEGAKFGPRIDWRILVARYNYSVSLTTTGPELSATPQLSVSNYHVLEEYAKLCLEK